MSRAKERSKDHRLCVSIRRSGRLAAKVVLHLSSFDSRIFRKPIGRLEMALGRREDDLTTLVRCAVQRARDLGWAHLLARVGCEQRQMIDVLEQNGFIFTTLFTGFQLNLTIPLDNGSGMSGPFRTRLARLSDLASLQRIARESFFSGTHYHGDPHLSSRDSTRLHEVWVTNALCGTDADVWVAAKSGHVAGFITVQCPSRTKEKSTTIGLVAVSRRFRRQGVGSALLRTVFQWARSRKLHWLNVGTEGTNLPAANLYENFGFRLRRTALWMHRYLV